MTLYPLLLFALHASELINGFVAYHYPVVKSSKENSVVHYPELHANPAHG